MALYDELNWIWDFWIADTGDKYHLFYLYAPRNLGAEQLRHSNARIGHAVSDDLKHWAKLGEALGPGPAGAPDGTATWTGSVVFDPHSQLWNMAYTGSRFVDASGSNVQTVGRATSKDLTAWEKDPQAWYGADNRWYETLPDKTWHEEAWRDPWLRQTDNGWEALLTARAKGGRAVLARATSTDLISWDIHRPCSTSDDRFVHLEVPQHVDGPNGPFIVFSCPSSLGEGRTGGIWVAPMQPSGIYDVTQAVALTDMRLYSGRIYRTRSGKWVLMAFKNFDGDQFVGEIADPLELSFDTQTEQPLPRLTSPIL